MFKKIATGASALALVTGLVACSPSDGGETSEVSETSETSEVSEAAEKPTKPFDRPDVNGLTVSEACEKVRAAGWRVGVVQDAEWKAANSHCGDSERRVVEAAYFDDEEGESIVDFRFVNEEAPESAVE